MALVLKEHGLGVGSEESLSAVEGCGACPQTHGLPVGAQPLLGMQHVVDAPSIALQQVFPPLLTRPWTLASGEGQVLPAAFLALQDPVEGQEQGEAPTPAPGTCRVSFQSERGVGQTKLLAQVLSSLWLHKGHRLQGSRARACDSLAE